MAEEISQVKKPLNANQLAGLIFVTALVFGVWLRLNPVLLAGFPMNDGGMFFRMIEELRQNHYALPAYTSYNNQQIPFDYPPLAFYLAGFAADLFRISVTSVLLWLPAIFNIATIPAFYLLANEILETRLKAALAAFLYTFLPLSMDWFLMGGGLTRGLGQLCLILTCWGALRLFRQPSRSALVSTILSGAVVVLCHPESALLTVLSAVVIWLFSSRSRQTIGLGLGVTAGIAVLAAPWFITVVSIHGLAPFLKASQTNGNDLFLWTKILTFDFTQEPTPTFIAILGLIGLFAKISQKKYFLPVWLIVPFFIDPRSSSRAAILPLAMLASICLVDIVLPALKSFATGASDSQPSGSFPASLAGYLLSFFLLFNFIINGYNLGLKMAANRLGTTDQQAMAWVQQNTPPAGNFVIVTGEQQLLRDPVQEWFPALTGRTSQTTLQGREWTWGNKFIQSVLTFGDLQGCITQDAQCVSSEARKLGLPFDFLYVKKPENSVCSTGENCRYNGKSLIDDLKRSAEYRLVYENDGATIFTKTGSFTP